MKECECVLEALEASGQYRYAAPALGPLADDWIINAYKTACQKHFPLALAFWPGDLVANSLAGAEIVPPSKSHEYLAAGPPEASRIPSTVPLSGLCPPGKFGVPLHAKHGTAELPFKSPADMMASAQGVAEEFGPPEPTRALPGEFAQLHLSEPSPASAPAASK